MDVEVLLFDHTTLKPSCGFVFTTYKITLYGDETFYLSLSDL